MGTDKVNAYERYANSITELLDEVDNAKNLTELMKALRLDRTKNKQ